MREPNAGLRFRLPPLSSWEMCFVVSERCTRGPLPGDTARPDSFAQRSCSNIHGAVALPHTTLVTAPRKQSGGDHVERVQLPARFSPVARLVCDGVRGVDVCAEGMDTLGYLTPIIPPDRFRLFLGQTIHFLTTCRIFSRSCVEHEWYDFADFFTGSSGTRHVQWSTSCSCCDGV